MSAVYRQGAVGKTLLSRHASHVLKDAQHVQQAGRLPAAHIEYLADGLCSATCQQIRVNDILDMDEVTRLEPSP